MANKKPIAIDLFCGAGGMSLGVKQAGFKVAGAFDIEERHVLTYRKNFPSVRAHVLDLGIVTSGKILELAKCESQEIDLLFGGPPCQGFSVGGVRDPKDERNLLILDFIRLVRSIRPKYFILENVQGLLSKHNKPVLSLVIERAHRAGYRIATDVKALDAQDFGVPQRRRRVFILGHRVDVKPINYPARSPILNDDGKDYFPSVHDAIRDLPDVDSHEELFEIDIYSGGLGEPSHYGMLMRNERIEDSDTYSAYRYPVEALTGCLRTRHDLSVVQRFEKTNPGSAEPVSRYFRLDGSGVAPTIRAGTGNDRGSHTSPRPIHPLKPRCITVREAARLHSIPDWFQLHGTRWHAFRQIGNSVPPRMARMVASKAREALRE